MEFYEDPTYCAPPEPPPVDICEPAPLASFDPPAYEPPAAEIFPDVPAEPAAPVTPVAEAPQPVAAPEAYQPVAAPEAYQPVAAPEAYQPVAAPEINQPVADAPISSGTLLGPSTIGGSVDTGAWVGGAPDLGGSTTIGGSAPDLGGIRVEYNGTPVEPLEMPLTPGPFSAAAPTIFGANNAVLADSVLGNSGSTGTPASWMPGFNSDRDGLPNEKDPNPRDRFS